MTLRNRQPESFGGCGKFGWSPVGFTFGECPLWQLLLGSHWDHVCGAVQKQLVWERRWCFQLQNKRLEAHICITEEEWRSGRPLGACPGLPLDSLPYRNILLSSLNPSNRPWCPFSSHFSYIMLDWKAQVQFTQPIWVCWSFDGLECDYLPLIICVLYKMCLKIKKKFSRKIKAGLWTRSLISWQSAFVNHKLTKPRDELDGITESMDMSLSKLLEMVKNREAWRASVLGITKSRTRLSDWTTTRQSASCQSSLNSHNHVTSHPDCSPSKMYVYLTNQSVFPCKRF